MAQSPMRSAALFTSLLVFVTGSLLAQAPGELYTTDEAACQPEGCLHPDPWSVFLAGGPAPGICTGEGLPDGMYYFQVTNPSGSLLLSSDDPINRVVIIRGGCICGTTGNHKITEGTCPGSTKLVRLAPFLPTDSPCGEYKVWITPVEDYDPKLGGFHGFHASASRTHNFLVEEGGPPPGPQSIIQGYKFYDYNENGVWNEPDPFEVQIPGWRVELWRGGPPFAGGILDGVTFTDAGGRFQFIRPRDGTTYWLREAAPCPGGATTCAPGSGFLNPPGSSTPSAVGARWLATNPPVVTVVANTAVVEGPRFGNIRLELAVDGTGAGPGRTKGFWHNAGQPLLAACEPDWRVELNDACLRTPISSADPLVSLFIPPPASNFYALPFGSAFSMFSNWIVGFGASGHAGYLLSTQVAATILNSTCGFMQGTIYVDRFQNGQLVSLAGMLEGATGLLCYPGAGLTGPKDPLQPSPIPGMDLRTAMLNCTNEFDTINNTGSSTEPQVIYKSAPAAGEVNSPYEG